MHFWVYENEIKVVLLQQKQVKHENANGLISIIQGKYINSIHS